VDSLVHFRDDDVHDARKAKGKIMRFDSAHQVETREIDDSELDGVSGGLSLGGLNLAPVTDISPTLGGITAPLGGLTATLGGVTAPLNGIVSSI
jgi:hypothetical protein